MFILFTPASPLPSALAHKGTQLTFGERRKEEKERRKLNLVRERGVDHVSETIQGLYQNKMKTAAGTADRISNL